MNKIVFVDFKRRYAYVVRPAETTDFPSIEDEVQAMMPWYRLAWQWLAHKFKKE